MKITSRAAILVLTAGLGAGGFPALLAQAAPVPVEFRNSSGADGTMPQYLRLAPDATALTSLGTLYTESGQPLANRVVAVYVYTKGKRGERIGAGTTDAQGAFRFDSTLTPGWSTDERFNVQLAFDDADRDDNADYGSAAAVLRPVATEPRASLVPVATSGTPTPTRQPAASATPSTASATPRPTRTPGSSASPHSTTKSATPRPTVPADTTIPRTKDKHGGLAKTGAAVS